MTLPIVTAEWLRELGIIHAEHFAKLYPNGAAITPKNVRDWLTEKFDLDGFAERVLPAAALKAYKKHTGAAYPGFREVRAAVQATYDEGTTAAWAECKKVRNAAQAAYEKRAIAAFIDAVNRHGLAVQPAEVPA